MKTGFETKYDEGYEKGKDYGLEKGTETTYRANVRRLLERRFGLLPATVIQRLGPPSLDHATWPRNCSTNVAMSWRPNDEANRQTKLVGSPTPVSATGTTVVVAPVRRKAMRISPFRPLGNPCLRLFEISSFISNPHGMA